jgi:hypothetical protein
VAPPPPVCLERRSLVTVAKVSHAPLEKGEGHFSTKTLNKKRLQLQQVCRAVYRRKQKGHVSRRTLNNQRLGLGECKAHS